MFPDRTQCGIRETEMLFSSFYLLHVRKKRKGNITRFRTDLWCTTGGDGGHDGGSGVFTLRYCRSGLAGLCQDIGIVDFSAMPSEGLFAILRRINCLKFCLREIVW